MHFRIVGVVLALTLAVIACGDEDTGEDEELEPIRCGSIHWSDSAGQDVYTGCEGNDGSWSCECSVDPSVAFQGSTAQANDTASGCPQAVAQTCSTTIPLIQPCARSSDNSRMCWNVADEHGDVSGDTFDCRCEPSTAPSEISAQNCQGALDGACFAIE